MLKSFIFSFVLTGCSITCVLGQIDTGSLDLDREVGQWFDEQFGIVQTSLAIGVMPTITSYGKSNPLFNDGQWYLAAIRYQGQVYQGINTLYNLEEDYLAVKHPSLSNELIKLENSSLDWFKLNDGLFVYLADVASPGIYQSLYAGQGIHLYKKHKKELIVDQDTHAKTYDLSWSYVIHRQGQLIDVTRKKDMLLAFKAYRKPLKKFIRAKKLSFSTESEDYNWIQLIESKEKWMTK